MGTTRFIEVVGKRDNLVKIKVLNESHANWLVFFVNDIKNKMCLIEEDGNRYYIIDRSMLIKCRKCKRGIAEYLSFNMTFQGVFDTILICRNCNEQLSTEKKGESI